MKISATLALLFALLASSAAMAQSAGAQNDHAAHHGDAAHSSAKTYSTTGSVKKIDVAKGGVTFAHDPIPALGWPAMTMNFSVRNKQLFSKLQVGKRASIEFRQEGAENIVEAVN